MLPRQVRRTQLLWISIINSKKREDQNKSFDAIWRSCRKRQRNDETPQHKGREETLQTKKDVELKGKVVLINRTGVYYWRSPKVIGGILKLKGTGV